MSQPHNTFPDIGANIVRLREATGLSQRELAQAAGMDVRTLRGYEENRVSIRLRAACAVMDTLGVPLDALAARECQTERVS